MSNEYSPYKMIHHLESLHSGNPVSACWIITHECNHVCIDCVNRNTPDFSPHDEPSLEQLINVAKQLKRLGVKAVSLSGGEPTIHKEFNAFARYLLNNSFDVGMVTNGSLLPYTDIEALSRFKFVRVSVNAMNVDTYKLVCNTSLPDYWDMLKDYVPAIQADGCMVSSSFLLRPEVLGEMYRFAEWSKDVGFNTCRFGYVLKKGGKVVYTEEQKTIIDKQLKSAMKLSDDSFAVYPFSERLNLTNVKQYSHCYVSDLIVVISANMNLYRCGPNQNNPKACLGNLNNNSLADIWKNRGSQDVSKCGICWSDEKNKFAEYLIDCYPTHRNFI